MKYTSIAKTIITHSLELKKGDYLYITVKGTSQQELGKEIEKVAHEMGIRTSYYFRTTAQQKDFYENCTEEELDDFIEKESKIMRECDGVALLGENVSSNLSAEARKKADRYFLEVHEKIRLKKKWLLTGAPCMEECNGDENLYNEMMETFISSCSIDYEKMSKAQDALVKRLSKADKVRIIAKDTDLSFSIKGLPPVKCIGDRNLPDGEVFTAPVKDSVNGFITYNLPSKRNGFTHNNIRLDFKNGKIINCCSDHTKELIEAFETDEGARYVGEFSFGINPLVNKCFNNILYDEKISGSIHFTPGAAYDECFNGNKSAIHWDLVQSHTPEFGGGEIWLDDELIRKDGRFVVEDLVCLNPENLV